MNQESNQMTSSVLVGLFLLRMKGKTDLSKFNNSWYKPGGKLKRVLWYYVNVVFFQSSFTLGSSLKRSLLRLFGAKIGKGVVIKPSVNIKYPWFLEIGDFTWIGEKAWIDNLGLVRIGAHCCLSQGSLLLSGNHDYKKDTFDLLVKDIILEDGVWIGAKATVVQGVTCKTHAILSVNSLASQDLESYSIYQGVPAVKIRDRDLAQ